MLILSFLWVYEIEPKINFKALSFVLSEWMKEGFLFRPVRERVAS